MHANYEYVYRESIVSRCILPCIYILKTYYLEMHTNYEYAYLEYIVSICTLINSMYLENMHLVHLGPQFHCNV